MLWYVVPSVFAVLCLIPFGFSFPGKWSRLPWGLYAVGMSTIVVVGTAYDMNHVGMGPTFGVVTTCLVAAAVVSISLLMGRLFPGINTFLIVRLTKTQGSA